MTGNPELRRNLWLELTPHRLIAMPVVLGAMFTMAYVLAGYELGLLVRLLALGLFFLLAVAWGMRLTAETLLEEVRGRTWDIQKLSALEPWTMTWGKLLGASAYAWYGALLCLVAFVAAGNPPGGSIKIALIAALFAIMAQGLSLVTALLAVRRRPDGGGAASGLAVVLMLVLAVTLGRNLVSADLTVVWFSRHVAASDFLLASLALFAAWAVAGCYRLMCLELAVRTTPWVWLAFAAFCSVYLAGFALRGQAAQPVLTLVTVGFAAALVLTYLAAFWDRKDPLAIRELGLLWRARRCRRLLQALPPWTVTLALAAVLAAVLAPTPRGAVLAAGALERGVGIAAVPVLMLAVRDIALLLYFSFAPGARRAEMTALVYLLLLYWLVPGLLVPMDLEWLARLILPPVGTQPLVSTLILAVHLAVIGWLLLPRWRQRLARVPG